MNRRTLGTAGAVGVVGLMLAVAAVWQPQGPWFGPNNSRSTQTAVARTQTATGQLGPTRTPTASATPKPTATATLTRTPVPTATITPTGVPPAPATPTGVATVMHTPLPTPVGAVETPPPSFTPIPQSGTPTATWWTGQTYPQYSGPTLTPPVFIPYTGATRPLDAEEQSYLTFLNDYRVSLGLNRLIVDDSLSAACQWMAADAALYGYLSHHDRFGRDSGWRMNDFGSSPWTWRGEVALGGSETGADAFTVFHLSAGHDPAQRDEKYVIAGVGRAWGSLDGWRWYACFGSDPGSSWPTATPAPLGATPRPMP